jgi:hypothetical protein
MEDDFLNGIDEAFQRLMKNGNGKRGHQAMDRSSGESSLIAEIVDHLHSLSKPQQQQVLTFVRSLQRQRTE